MALNVLRHQVLNATNVAEANITNYTIFSFNGVMEYRTKYRISNSEFTVVQQLRVK